MDTLILKTNINNDITEKGMIKVKELLNSISFPFEYKIVNSSFKYTSLPFTGASEEVRSGYMVSPNEIYLEAKKLNNGFSYDLATLIFNPNFITPKPTNPVCNGDVMQIPNDWFAEDINAFVLYFLHELCHHRFWATKRYDTTHDFYTSEFKQMSDGFIKYYLHLLSQMKPEAKQKQINNDLPIVYLKRAYGDNKQQLGDLTFGNFKCKTMELSWRNNQRNISNIPKGKHLMKWTFSPRFGRFTYEIFVAGRNGIRIHSASWYSQLNGCIALGTHYGDLNRDNHADILNSRITVKKFEELLNKRDAWLIIE